MEHVRKETTMCLSAKQLNDYIRAEYPGTGGVELALSLAAVGLPAAAHALAKQLPKPIGDSLKAIGDVASFSALTMAILNYYSNSSNASKLEDALTTLLGMIDPSNPYANPNARVKIVNVFEETISTNGTHYGWDYTSSIEVTGYCH